jgi:hypothetical protein
LGISATAQGKVRDTVGCEEREQDREEALKDEMFLLRQKSKECNVSKSTKLPTRLITRRSLV